MIQIVPQVKIYVAVEPVDFRRGIDGLAFLCKSILQQDPFSGSLFLFTNRSRKSIKILVYDGQGFWLCLKRLSRGKINWWPKRKGNAAISLKPAELQVLIYNGNPENTNLQSEWRKLY